MLPGWLLAARIGVAGLTRAVTERYARAATLGIISG